VIGWRPVLGALCGTEKTRGLVVTLLDGHTRRLASPQKRSCNRFRVVCLWEYAPTASTGSGAMPQSVNVPYSVQVQPHCHKG